MLRIDTYLCKSMTSCLVFSGSLGSTRLLSVAQELQTFKQLEPVSSFRLRRWPCEEQTEIESREAVQRGCAESRNGSPSCSESGKRDGLWNGFSAHCVIVWKKVRAGNKKHLKLKKKVEARLKEAKKLRLIFPFTYTQPSRPQTCLPLPLMSGEVEVPMEGSFSDLEMSNLVSKGNWWREQIEWVWKELGV